MGVVGGMKQNHYRTHAGSAHQTVTEEIKVKTGEKTIRILAGKQKLSGHAGQTTFWGFLEPGFAGQACGVAASSADQPKCHQTSGDRFGIHRGDLPDAERLTQIAHLRGDPVLPEVL